jgi:predicted ArsR family transcriptional regulator
MQEYGYAPYRTADGVVRLRNCPFHELARQHPSLVCGANLSLLRGFVAGLGLEGVEVTLDPLPGECCVAFRPARQS